MAPASQSVAASKADHLDYQVSPGLPADSQTAAQDWQIAAVAEPELAEPELVVAIAVELEAAIVAARFEVAAVRDESAAEPAHSGVVPGPAEEAGLEGKDPASPLLVAGAAVAGYCTRAR